MRRVFKFCLATAVAALALAPAAARAEGYVSPFIGSNFGAGQADGRANFGFDAGWMGKGIIGGEFDFGYAPNFFGSVGNFGDNHVMTAMGNLIVGVPIGNTFGKGVKPYGTIGFGLVRSQLNDPTSTTGDTMQNDDFGLNAGFGVMGYLSKHAGLRGDVRYFRNTSATDNAVEFGGFHYWRASFGVVLK